MAQTTGRQGPTASISAYITPEVEILPRYVSNVALLRIGTYRDDLTVTLQMGANPGTDHDEAAIACLDHLIEAANTLRSEIIRKIVETSGPASRPGLVIDAGDDPTAEFIDPEGAVDHDAAGVI